MLSSMYITSLEGLLSDSIDAFLGIPANPPPCDSGESSVCVIQGSRSQLFLLLENQRVSSSWNLKRPHVTLNQSPNRMCPKRKIFSNPLPDHKRCGQSRNSRHYAQWVFPFPMSLSHVSLLQPDLSLLHPSQQKNANPHHTPPPFPPLHPRQTPHSTPIVRPLPLNPRPSPHHNQRHHHHQHHSHPRSPLLQTNQSPPLPPNQQTPVRSRARPLGARPVAGATPKIQPEPFIPRRRRASLAKSERELPHLSECHRRGGRGRADVGGGVCGVVGAGRGDEAVFGAGAVARDWGEDGGGEERGGAGCGYGEVGWFLLRGGEGGKEPEVGLRSRSVSMNPFHCV